MRLRALQVILCLPACLVAQQPDRRQARLPQGSELTPTNWLGSALRSHCPWLWPAALAGASVAAAEPAAVSVPALQLIAPVPSPVNARRAVRTPSPATCAAPPAVPTADVHFAAFSSGFQLATGGPAADCSTGDRNKSSILEPRRPESGAEGDAAVGQAPCARPHAAGGSGGSLRPAGLTSSDTAIRSL
jgi:hypothetical protein